MKKLKMKARAGVTLVELLVVILIVTILSVSMLPLLQPFVVESQYAAEPIPVIGNLRTKISVYQYDKGSLPCIEADSNGVITNPKVETWMAVDTANGTTESSTPGAVDFFAMASGDLPSTYNAFTKTYFDATTVVGKYKHFGNLCDIDYQELKGKRSRPNHYQYLVMENGTDYAFFVGCFGDGNGLKMGTGYAVCEIVSPKTGHKYVGTWKRYKAVGDGDNQICFTTDTSKPLSDPDVKHTFGCFVPDANSFQNKTDVNGQLDIIGTMETYGWEF